MSEYDQSSAYENYDSNDDLSPYELLMQMQSWNKAIYLRIENAEKELQTQFSILDGEIRQEVSDFEEEMSTLMSTTAAGIRTEIRDLDEGLSTVITETAAGIRADIVDGDKKLTNQIITTAEGIRTDMVNADKQLSTQITTTAAGINATIASTKEGLQTQISATAAGLASKVSYSDYTGQTVASLISQDANAISLLANKLNLSGYVTFSSLGAYGTTVIDGSRIQTGYISADRLDAQAIRSKVIQAGGISADYVQAGNLVGMSITGSTFYQTSGWGNVSINSGQVTTYDGFIGATATMNGQFSASGSGGSISAAPGALNISGSSGSVRITPSEFWSSGSGMSVRGTFDFSQAGIFGLKVQNADHAISANYLQSGGTNYFPSDFAATRTAGLGFGFSTASGLLYVDLYGTSRGSVKIT